MPRIAQSPCDGADNLIRTTDREGRVTSFEYDDLDRLTDETWHGYLSREWGLQYNYDAVGNLLSASDRIATVEFTYDDRNRVKTADNLETLNTPSVLLAYGYDGVGNVVAIEESIEDIATASTDYDYYQDNRVETIAQSGNEVGAKRVDFVYNQLGQFDLISRYASLDRSGPAVTTDYSYDELNRVQGITHDGQQGNIAFYNYTYDAASRIRQIESIDGTALYSYDDRSQLLKAGYSAPELPDERFRYDSNGNRTASNLHGGDYETGDANRLLSDGTYNYEYDKEGNLVLRMEITTENTRRFVYDFRNRLTEVSDTDSDGNAVQRVVFAYDVLALDQARPNTLLR